MTILNSLQKSISWKHKRTEKAVKDDSSVRNVRPGLIHVVEEGKGPNVDIVYIHGLSGGRNASEVQDTFSTTELSLRNPNARILSWSYDTRAYKSGYKFEDVLESHTKCLLEELATVRSKAENERRPIVFIAQSLGGMLVKKALLKSCEAGIEESGPNTVNMGIKQSTLGAVFLGPALASMADPGTVTDKLYKLQNEEFQGLCKDVFVHNVPCEPPSPPPTAIRPPPQRRTSRFGIKRTRTSSSSETDTSSQQSNELPRAVLETVHTLCTTSSLEDRHSAMRRDDEKAQSPVSDTFQDNFDIGLVPKSTPTQGNRFIGREQKLLELFDKLSPHRDEPDGRIVVLHGNSGCGKTRLALECCRRNETSFSTIFWINASSVQSIQSSYALFAKALTDHYATQLADPSDSRDSIYRYLGLSDPVNDKTREDGFEQIAGTPLIEAINMWFSNVRNANWLMVLDDIDESDVTILADFFPTPVSGHILIITQLEGYSEQHGYQDVALGNMTKAESTSLLLSLMDPKLIGPSQDDSLALKAADGCNHSPISITQAANFMNTMSLTLQTYLNMTKTTNHKWSVDLWNGYNETQVDEILTAQQPVSKAQLKGYGESTITTYADWEHQFQELEHSDPTALDLLTLCSFFAKDEIPVSLLKEAVTMYRPEESTDRQFEHILKDLAQRSLINRRWIIAPRKLENDAMSWISGRDSPELLFPMLETSSAEFNLNVLHPQNNHNETANCITINHLVHHWAQKRLNPVTQGVMAERAFQALALAIQSSKRPPSDLIGLEVFLPHLQACLESLDMVDGDPKVDVKWSVLADVCRYQGLHQVARKFYKFSLKKIESELERPSSRIEAARLRMTLGFVYIQQKHLEKAEKQYKKATSHICEAAKQINEDHQDFGKIANLELKISASLASLYKIQKRFEEAEEQYYSILPRFEQVWGSEDIRTLLLLEQFASCLLADGNYEEAEALYRRVLVSYVNVFGREYPAVAKIQQKLAKTLQLQGRYERAEGVLQQALTTIEKRLGTEHPETINLLLFMAQLKCRSRKYEAAEKIYEELLSSQQKMAGGVSNAALLELRVNLGKTYQGQKKYSQAGAMFQEALGDLRKNQKDKTSPQHERELMLKLKAFYDESGQAGSKEAEQLCDEFLEKFPNDEVSTTILVQRKRQVTV